MSARILAGRYELLERIGDGGMAVVYKARCRLLNRFVAIKILKPDFTKDVKFIENFKKESQSAASLSHPNIVSVYDVGREGNINYIVMELIEGKVLSDFIKEEAPLDYVRAIEITKQIASALSLAHKNNIIHRDVKPHNVLITQNGTAKITDFGIAKAIDSSTLVDHDGMIMGSVHYFSPEQARGGYVDEKSDIYSLGIVLYEMLTGKVPFDGDNPISVALMHVNENMTPPSKLVDGIPPRLEQIVMKATDKIQINRYKSADEMLEALNSLEYVSSIVGATAVGGIRRVSPEPEKTPAPDVPENANDNEESDEITKKGGKGKLKINKMRLIAIVLAIVLGIPLSMLLASFLSGGAPQIAPATEIEVPSIIGLTVEEATEKLYELGLGLRIRDQVIHPDFEAGQIVSQEPVEGIMVREGREIVVNISRGGREGAVPRIIGMLESEVETVLNNFGFAVGARTSRPDSAPVGVVIGQNPEPGSDAPPGSTVSFVVSEGPAAVQEATVPEIVGLTLDAAIAALQGAGLISGTITEEETNAYAPNTVIWQEFEAGHRLYAGTPVNFRVSIGGEEEYVPENGDQYENGENGEPGENGEIYEPDEPNEIRSIPFTIHFSLSENQVFFLTVTITDEDGTRNVDGIVNQQRIRDDGSETVTLVGRGSGVLNVIIDGNVALRRNVNFNTGEIY